MTTPPKPIEDTQDIPADIEMQSRAIAERICPWSEADEIASFKAAKWEVIAKAILSERQRNEWQPIETADKNAASLMLGIVRRGVLEEIHIGGYRYAINDDEVSCWWSDQADDEIVPTHWMTLPSPPKTDNPHGNNRFSRKGE